MSLEHSRQTCFVHRQTGTAHHAQQTDLTNRQHLTCSTNREKNNKGKTCGRHPSANSKRQHQQTSVMRKLNYTSRFVRVIPKLSPNQTSHNSIGHGGRYNMVVTASTSQHPASKRLSSDELFCPQSCEHNAPILRCLHHRRSAIFPSLRGCGSNNSAQCSSTPETLQFLHRGMSKSSFLPNCPEVLVANVLSSCLPRFPERSCRLVLQQVFHVQSFNTALRDRRGL